MKLLSLIKKFADDLLCLAGAVLVTYATWQLSPIAAIYTAGGFCIVAGVLIGLGGNKR